MNTEDIIQMLDNDIKNITSLRESGIYPKHDAYLLKKYAKKIIGKIKNNNSKESK